MAADPAELSALNDALFLLGQEPVAGVADADLQGSVALVKLLRVVDQARDTALRRHGWTCALRYDVMAPASLADYSNFRYPTVFKLPGEFLRLWELEGQPCGSWDPDLGWIATWSGYGPRWQMGSHEDGSGSTVKVLRTSQLDSANVVWIKRIGYGAMDAHVLDYFAHELAARGCFSITGDVQKAKELHAQAEEKALMAISVDGTQEGGQPAWAPSRTAAIRAMSR